MISPELFPMLRVGRAGTMRRTPKHSHFSKVWLLLTLILGLTAVPAQALEDETPPTISNPTVSPSSLPKEGGSVTISANIFDESGITAAWATVTGQDGFGQSVGIFDFGGNFFSGGIDIPQNFTDQTLSYQVEVGAVDGNGLSSTEPAGEIQVEAQPQFDEAPFVFDPSVEPDDLPSTGGAVTIQASASDDRAISEVYAVVTGPGGTTTLVSMEGISSSRFQGVFDAPPNASTSPVLYSVEITALDDIGQFDTESAGFITVAANAAGLLEVRPEQRFFGQVRVGESKRMAVTVKNGSPGSTPPITGVLALSSDQFSIVGAGSEPVPFELAPGESLKVSIRFRPTSSGLKTGRLLIIRSDGGQPDLGVELSGRGGRRSPLPWWLPVRFLAEL
jgi:hypothetical protein